MKKNQSKMRFGTAKQREAKCQRRVRIMRDCREAGMTWNEIGRRYGITRQGARTFYNDNIHLLESE